MPAVQSVRRPVPPRTATFAFGLLMLVACPVAAQQQRLYSTLTEAGWRYREQFGSMHAIERDDLVLSVSIKLHTGTRVRESSISLQRRSDPAA